VLSISPSMISSGPRSVLGVNFAPVHGLGRRRPPGTAVHRAWHGERGVQIVRPVSLTALASVPELVVGERDGAAAVGRAADHGGGWLRAENGSGSTPRNGADRWLPKQRRRHGGEDLGEQAAERRPMRRAFS
jgi:hypothetical protein